jgi:hypothetical protein
MRWHVRSVADQDTHLGRRNGTRIHAMCGVEFPITALTVTLPGLPPDPQQVCPDCRTRWSGGKCSEVK